nr:O-fucosyltransferase 7 isoform X1 [Ipomoea batatas]GMD94027.1 O-fucosyltransferase 7 isoform X1 [Ipomoea batatas]GME04852.1 O-fucosyltransferase 7 isoform X1 [Ipomoea batatas]GME17368.1 O-fucosyltransferase 7 isoform X1 [Ipomoea batatas]GME19280.1 O-fucosyltransferase 7 isoform X1 [Ipomoea batatas]
MQRRRWRTVLAVRQMLKFAIGVIALLALLSVHVELIFPPSAVIKLPEKLPMPYELGYQRLSREGNWMHEPSLPARKVLNIWDSNC